MGELGKVLTKSLLGALPAYGKEETLWREWRIGRDESMDGCDGARHRLGWELDHAITGPFGLRVFIWFLFKVKGAKSGIRHGGGHRQTRSRRRWTSLRMK